VKTRNFGEGNNKNTRNTTVHTLARKDYEFGRREQQRDNAAHQMARRDDFGQGNNKGILLHTNWLTKMTLGGGNNRRIL
jgi:hypothetical protein